MGFVGLGGQGGGHLFGGAWTYLPGGYLGRDDVQVLGVCDVQRKRAEDAAGRVERHYADRSGLGNYAAAKRTMISANWWPTRYRRGVDCRGLSCCRHKFAGRAPSRQRRLLRKTHQRDDSRGPRGGR